MKITEEQKNLLRTAKNEFEWNDACDHIKSKHNGAYPSDWFQEILCKSHEYPAFNPSIKLIKL